MKQFKLTFLLTILLSMFGVKSFAYDIAVKNSDGVTIYYSFLSESELAVDCFPNYEYYTGIVKIPERVFYEGENYSVTSIDVGAFSGCSGLTSVTIPNSVTSIGNSAFYNCSGLTSVTIPNSVTTIGESAFYKCSGLTTATIGNSVTSIGKSTFEYCSGLTSATIGNSVTTIGSWAFKGCSSLTSITIPNSVMSIESNAFEGCSGITSLTIGNSVTDIGTYAFSGCNGLTNIKVPVTDYSAFCNNKTLGAIGSKIGKPIILIDKEGCEIKEYVIPEDVTSIGSAAFYNCSGLTSVTIGNSVTSIGSAAFYNCSGLTSVTIGNSVTSIGSAAFSYCSNLTSVTFHCKEIDSWFMRYSSIKEIVIGDEVTSIDDYAFFGCEGLTSIKVSVSDYSAFCNNKVVGELYFQTRKPIFLIDKEGNEIKEYVIPEDVTSIGDYAFLNTNLKSVTIGAKVLTIGRNAFYNSSLGHLGQPVKVIWMTNTPPKGYIYASGTVNYVSNDLYTSLGNVTIYPFLSSLFEVNGVKYVPVSPSERTCVAIDCVYDESAANIHIGKTVSYKGIEMAVKDVNSYTCYGNTSIKDVQLNFEGNIGDYAFYCCSSINTAVISNQGNIGTRAFANITGEFTVTINNSGSIGANAFIGSTGLTKLDIGEKVICIGDYAFSECSSLELAKLLNQGPVGEYAFSNCTSMTNVTLGNMITSIGQKAFSNCTSMTNATLGSKITSIGKESFSNCSSLQSISIPNAVKSLGGYAFQNCSSMTSAKIGNGITIINIYTFSGCSALIDIQIGTGVKSIDVYSFDGCSSLPKIEIPKNVTDIKDNTFRNCSQLKNVNITDRDEVLNLGSNGSSPLFVDCPLEEIYIGGNISYPIRSSYGYSPFYRNTSLHTVTITDKETEISPNEFYGCTSLKNVTIGDGVTTIGDRAFSGCASLENFSYGVMVSSIGQEAFSDCTAITKLVSHATTPPVCGSQALDDINKWTCILSVPKGVTAAYQAADQWKDFFFINDDLENTTVLGDANGDMKVNVSDIVEIVNDILGKPSAKYNRNAADVNGDGQVNVTDIVNVVNIIMTSGSSASARRAASNNSLWLDGGTIRLRNAENYTATQFDINLSEGQSVGDISLSSTSNHQLTWQMVDENTCRVVVYSLSNAPFHTTDDVLFNITLNGSATICNELLIDADGSTTAVEQIQQDKPVDVYDLRGNKVRSNVTDLRGLAKGIYIINGKKVIHN